MSDGKDGVWAKMRKKNIKKDVLNGPDIARSKGVKDWNGHVWRKPADATIKTVLTQENPRG